ncbi:hypothetical protein C8J57DRAFT_1246363 [Mycena rebaudengoi]|nr:hypothetical protein C8J57DRAFT_1246363 [Mycena rebaudengoi]
MSGAILSRASLIPLDDSLGAWFIAIIVSSVLFGVTCLQVYLYFTKHCGRDPVFLKTFVALLLALDTFNLALVSHAFYFITVTNFGDYGALGIPPWSHLVSIMDNAPHFVQIAVGSMEVWSWIPTHFIDFLLVFVATFVQLFYAFRIYALSNKSLVLPVIIVIQRAGNSYCAQNVKYFSKASEDIPYFAGTLSITVACDVLIASAMVYHLLRNKTGFHK